MSSSIANHSVVMDWLSSLLENSRPCRLIVLDPDELHRYMDASSLAQSVTTGASRPEQVTHNFDALNANSRLDTDVRDRIDTILTRAG